MLNVDTCQERPGQPIFCLRALAGTDCVNTAMVNL